MCGTRAGTQARGDDRCDDVEARLVGAAGHDVDALHQRGQIVDLLDPEVDARVAEAGPQARHHLAEHLDLAPPDRGRGVRLTGAIAVLDQVRDRPPSARPRPSSPARGRATSRCRPRRARARASRAPAPGRRRRPCRPARAARCRNAGSTTRRRRPPTRRPAGPAPRAPAMPSATSSGASSNPARVSRSAMASTPAVPSHAPSSAAQTPSGSSMVSIDARRGEMMIVSPSLGKHAQAGAEPRQRLARNALDVWLRHRHAIMQRFPRESHSSENARVRNPQIAVKKVCDSAESTTNGGGGAYRGGHPQGDHTPTGNSGVSSHGRWRHGSGRRPPRS